MVEIPLSPFCRAQQGDIAAEKVRRSLQVERVLHAFQIKSIARA